jgi:hypothetical protein
MPLPRDSVTLLKPPWVRNHPVACGNFHSKYGVKTRNENIIPDDLK